WNTHPLEINRMPHFLLLTRIIHLQMPSDLPESRSTGNICGYSIPHPSEARVNIRVQTTGEPAREVLKDSCQDLMLMCQHIRGTFDKAVNDFRTKNPPDNHPSPDMDSD
ncbi:RNA_pol_L_2 domain-containing protein, partial [Psidium guajava]